MENSFISLVIFQVPQKSHSLVNHISDLPMRGEGLLSRVQLYIF